MSVKPAPRFFFIIGAMKAGTTSLYKYLAGHPELYASPRKEPRVFREDDDPARLRKNLLDLFVERNGQAWCFEASTAYTKFPLFPGVPARVRSVVPDARFIYLVRSPVERAWSQYVHNLAHGRETRPFVDAIAAGRHYVDISRYHLQLSQYHDVFPPDRVLVQVFEEMVADPDTTVRNVCRFLGVDDAYRPAARDVAFNASSSKRAATPALRLARSLGLDEALPWRVRHWLVRKGAALPEKRSQLTYDVRARLVDSFRNDTEAFFKLIGRRIPAWTDFA